LNLIGYYLNFWRTGAGNAAPCRERERERESQALLARLAVSETLR